MFALDNWMSELEPRRMLSAGQLDSHFGDHGVVTIPLAGTTYGADVAEQLDGKILASVDVSTSNGKTSGELFRFLSNGKLDTSFGGNGQIVTSAGIGQPVLTSNGRILVSVGEDLKRFDSNGRVDKTFGTNGVVKGAAGGVALLADGRILVAARSTVRRYHANGKLDTSFGVHGAATFPIDNPVVPTEPYPVFAHDIAVQPDGKILLSLQIGQGSYDGSITGGVVRFRSNGELDPTFGDGGFASTNPDEQNNLPVATVSTSDGGSVSLESNEDGGSWLVKLTKEGKFDKSFGDPGEPGVEWLGTFTLNDPGDAAGAALVQQADGKLICVMHVDNDEVGGVVSRSTADGKLDTTFAGTGKASISSKMPSAAVLGKNGDLIVATFDYGDQQFQLTGVQTEPPAAPRVNVSGGVLSVTGTSGHDVIQVDEANDLVTVTMNGQDIWFPYKSVLALRVNAGAGDDSVSVNSTLPYGATINGNAGDDNLQSINHRSILNGGPGNDTLITYHGGATLIGGTGNDTADFSSYSNDLVITLDNKSNDGPRADNDDVQADIENIIGGSGNDLIIGGPFANHLFGGPGNDTLWGGGGNDTLEGGHGHDQLFGQAGEDLLIARDNTRDSLDGGDGLDRASEDAVDLLTSVESRL